MSDVLLAVPNISEGRDHQTIAYIAGEKALLNVQSDPDHHRSVLTYGGQPRAVLEAVVAMVARAVAVLDVTDHSGVHPRFGVVDVLPFVAYQGDEDPIHRAIVDALDDIEATMHVPVLRYGRLSQDGCTLPTLRRAIRAELPVPHPTAGVICAGLRDVLIAFNVNCVGPLNAARLAAADLRRQPGVRALGFELLTRREVQLSMNLVDIDRTGPASAFVRASEAARRHGLRVIDAEIVGLVPERVRAESAALPLRWPVVTIEERLKAGSI